MNNRIPEAVFTRRLALAGEYVTDTTKVIQDGFTDEYFTVIIDNPVLTTKHQHASVVGYAAFGEYEMFRVFWEPADISRAASAIDGDFRETVGDQAADAIDALRNETHKTT